MPWLASALPGFRPVPDLRARASPGRDRRVSAVHEAGVCAAAPPSRPGPGRGEPARAAAVLRGHRTALAAAEPEIVAASARTGSAAFAPAGGGGAPAARPVPPEGRDLRCGQERGFPDVDAPEVAAALKAAVDDYAQYHRLGYYTAWGLDRGLRVLLSIQDTPGARFLASDVLLLRDLILPVKPLLRLLAQIDMLDDDRIPNIVPWLRERTAGLAEPMAGELAAWFELKLSGSTTAPRVKARPHRWIQRMVTNALPGAPFGRGRTRTRTRSGPSPGPTSSQPCPTAEHRASTCSRACGTSCGP